MKRSGVLAIVLAAAGGVWWAQHADLGPQLACTDARLWQGADAQDCFVQPRLCLGEDAACATAPKLWSQNLNDVAAQPVL
ncbi:MAG: hypothetical protein AAF218_07520 [Pseudomonadota bacterium]